MAAVVEMPLQKKPSPKKRKRRKRWTLEVVWTCLAVTKVAVVVETIKPYRQTPSMLTKQNPVFYFLIRMLQKDKTSSSSSIYPVQMH